MNTISVGDGAQFFASAQQNIRIKTELNTLATQLSSGEIKDKVAVLNGDTFRFSAIDHSLKTLASKSARNAETATLLSTMQRTLDTFDLQRGTLSETLTKISSGATQLQVQFAARDAADGFVTLVNTLNTTVAGRSLFAGTAVDQAPLLSAADMMADLVTSLGGATDEATIRTAVDTWFDDPAGGFATIGYLGDTGAVQTRRLDLTTEISIEVRADNQEIRDVLKGAALAALVNEVGGLSAQTQAALLFEAGTRLHSAATETAAVQGRLGFLESEVERVTVTQRAEREALTIARNDIANDDPFETASALQSVQIQLETHYQITARLSQLTLANYI